MTFVKDKIWQLLEQVFDPEIPVLSILDLGIVRKVLEKKNGEIEITITPTYSGCPAMNVIEIDMKSILLEHGYTQVKVKTVLSPAWTTNWLSPNGKAKLKAYGIAPPIDTSVDKNSLFAEEKKVPCPRCESINTQMISQFGSTACKSLYKCKDCLEPFDYFKCH